MKQQDYDNYSIIDNFYLYVKDPNKAIYQYLIKTSEKNSVERLKNPKAFIKYLNKMQDVYTNT